MKIAIYARVSPTRKAQKEFTAKSIQNQLNRCREQAKVDNVEIYGEFVDEYISGKAQEYMVEFQKMVDAANEKKFSKIYCLRVDRFGRNLQQMINTQKILQGLDIHIKFIDQGVDTSDTFGRMVMGIMASVAEWQRETILVNTQLGREIAYKDSPEKFGRPKSEINWKVVNSLLGSKKEGKYEYSWTQIAKEICIAPATLIRRYRAEFGELPSRRI